METLLKIKYHKKFTNDLVKQILFCTEKACLTKLSKGNLELNFNNILIYGFSAVVLKDFNIWMQTPDPKPSKLKVCRIWIHINDLDP